MKTFITHFKQMPSPIIWLGAILIALIFIQFLINKIKKNRVDSTLTKNGYGVKNKNGVDEIKYFIFYKWILFYKYNQGKTLQDFMREKDIFQDAFGIQISDIRRTFLRTILITKADYSKKLKRSKNQILLGWSGDSYIYLKEKQDTSIFISGTMSYGKTILLKSVLSQFPKVYPDFNKISIYTSKPEDFEHSLTYEQNEDEILDDLKKYEEQRQYHSLNKLEMKPTLIIVDECQNLSKEMASTLERLIKLGRSQNIFILMATQNSNISDMKNVSIANIAVKIICRNSQSIQSAEQLFDKSNAEDSYFKIVPLGYGFIKTVSIRTGKMIKFYYEQGFKP